MINNFRRRAVVVVWLLNVVSRWLDTYNSQQSNLCAVCCNKWKTTTNWKLNVEDEMEWRTPKKNAIWILMLVDWLTHKNRISELVFSTSGFLTQYCACALTHHAHYIHKCNVQFHMFSVCSSILPSDSRVFVVVWPFFCFFLFFCLKWHKDPLNHNFFLVSLHFHDQNQLIAFYRFSTAPFYFAFCSVSCELDRCSKSSRLMWCAIVIFYFNASVYFLLILLFMR